MEKKYPSFPGGVDLHPEITLPEAVDHEIGALDILFGGYKDLVIEPFRMNVFWKEIVQVYRGTPSAPIKEIVIVVGYICRIFYGGPFYGNVLYGGACQLQVLVACVFYKECRGLEGVCDDAYAAGVSQAEIDRVAVDRAAPGIAAKGYDDGFLIILCGDPMGLQRYEAAES